MSTKVKGHIVIFSFPGWGHIRGLVSLACKILQQRDDIGVTILTVGDVIKKADAEVARYIPHGDPLRNNLRIISVLDDRRDLFALRVATADAMIDAYNLIHSLQPITCMASGNTFQSWPKPKVVIFDLFLDVVTAIKGIDSTVTALVWYPGNNSASLRLAGPEALGGIGDIASKAVALSETSTMSIKALEWGLIRPVTGDLVSIPGLPPMYDYELLPQTSAIPVEKMPTQFFKGAQQVVRKADGIISPGTSAFETESLAAWRKWQSQRGKEFYVVGPLLPNDNEGESLKALAKNTEKVSSDKGAEIEEFLDKVLQEIAGERTLIYISFGSQWWPNEDQVWGFVEVLVEQRIPFIFALASPQAKVPAGIERKVQESGLGLFSTWAPQQLILAHEATGWFLSHCGQNSVIESLSEGVPMIAWPIFADQPESAALVSLSLNVAYQLSEARTGKEGLMPLKRGTFPTGTIEGLQREVREVLAEAYGKDGKVKRENAVAIKHKMKLSWGENGEAVTELRRLLVKEFPLK